MKSFELFKISKMPSLIWNCPDVTVPTGNCNNHWGQEEKSRSNDDLLRSLPYQTLTTVGDKCRCLGQLITCMTTVEDKCRCPDQLMLRLFRDMRLPYCFLLWLVWYCHCYYSKVLAFVTCFNQQHKQLIKTWSIFYHWIVSFLLLTLSLSRGWWGRWEKTPEGGRKGWWRKKALAARPRGPRQSGTCRVLGEGPKLHAMGVVKTSKVFCAYK